MHWRCELIEAEVCVVWSCLQVSLVSLLQLSSPFPFHSIIRLLVLWQRRKEPLFEVEPKDLFSQFMSRLDKTSNPERSL